MNKGLQIASGNIIGFLNADDFYNSNDVLRTVHETITTQNVDSCYGDLVYLKRKDTNRVLRYWKAGQFYPDKFYWGWMPPHPTFFVKRSIYTKYGNFDLRMGSAADYELMLRLLLKYRISTQYIPEILVNMRAGGVSNASITNRLVANKMDRQAWRINGINPFPWTIKLKPLRKVSQFIPYQNISRS
jgi:glycosyltransferase